MGNLANRVGSSLRRRFGEIRTSSIRRKLAAQMRELDRRNVSIISNNCVAGILYEWAGLPKQTPTAGIYFVGPAYAQFLVDLAANELDHWTRLTPSSLVYKEAQHCWSLPGPAGGELVFLHYPDATVAMDKWRRRLERLRGRTPLIISSVRDSIDPVSLAAVLSQFRLTFTVGGDPAPPADELVLNGRFLRSFSDYLDNVLAAAPSGRTVGEMLI